MPWIGFTLPALVVFTSHCCGLFLITFLHCACVCSRVKLLVPTVCVMYNYNMCVCVTQKCLFSILHAINLCQGLSTALLLLRYVTKNAIDTSWAMDWALDMCLSVTRHGPQWLLKIIMAPTCPLIGVLLRPQLWFRLKLRIWWRVLPVALDDHASTLNAGCQ